MEKYPMIIRNLTYTICVVLLFWGCDRISSASMKPTVVRKKIVAAEHQTVTADKKKPMAIAKSVPSIKKDPTESQRPDEKRPAPAKSPTSPDAGATAQPLLDNETKTVPLQGASTVSEKPPLRPKPDITQIKEPPQIQGLPSGGGIKAIDEPLGGDDLIAAAAVVAQTQESLQTPSRYDPTDKIDPFQPLYRDQPVPEKKKERKRAPQTPLERIDLSQLKLVGIILASSGNRALVEEATGKGYIIKKGTYIGTNAGKVAQIDKDKIIVEEEFEDVLGNTKTREKELKLPKPPGEF